MSQMPWNGDPAIWDPGSPSFVEQEAFNITVTKSVSTTLLTKKLGFSPAVGQAVKEASREIARLLFNQFKAGKLLPVKTFSKVSFVLREDQFSGIKQLTWSLVVDRIKHALPGGPDDKTVVAFGAFHNLKRLDSMSSMVLSQHLSDDLSDVEDSATFPQDYIFVATDATYEIAYIHVMWPILSHVLVKAMDWVGEVSFEFASAVFNVTARPEGQQRSIGVFKSFSSPCYKIPTSVTRRTVLSPPFLLFDHLQFSEASFSPAVVAPVVIRLPLLKSRIDIFKALTDDI